MGVHDRLCHIETKAGMVTTFSSKERVAETVGHLFGKIAPKVADSDLDLIGRHQLCADGDLPA